MHRVLTRSLSVFVAAALVMTACGDDGSSTVAVRPFDDVRASEMVFELDPSDPSRGIFRVTTTEPMICAIVWGTDGSFGRFNNSLSMNGTGIAQHDVSLPDVEPGVTYTYIVQGTTADGTLYRSERGTFRLDAAASTPAVTAAAPGRNIATNATITKVSSEFSAAFAASKAIDDDSSTEWATRGDGDNGSITLELAAVTDIKGAEFVTRSMADGSAITSTFTVSVDDGPSIGPYPAGTLATPRPAAFTARGRVVRFDIATSSGGNVGAVEIRVFA
ncbi:MAG TPA: discoidin domain-containing protein [Acidimicrobiales bacterium]|nr:discoidin domain-containing protein [Acidimicrobiales bacterium]